MQRCGITLKAESTQRDDGEINKSGSKIMQYVSSLMQLKVLSVDLKCCLRCNGMMNDNHLL